MSTFVLVHGAWHGRWCWSRVEDGLRTAGHATVSMDLPIDDGSATFLDYRDAVLGVWPDDGGDVIVVGHSLGAMVVPLVAGVRPVTTSVYLCPVVPNVEGMPWDDVPEMGSPGAFEHLRSQNSTSLWDRPFPLEALPPGRRLVVGGLQDRAITPDFLRAAAVHRLDTDPVWLDSDHSPFLSDAAALVDLLTASSSPP
jgi:pimeloyl-ACP methyl ester carboxylesterase